MGKSSFAFRVYPLRLFLARHPLLNIIKNAAKHQFDFYADKISFSYIKSAIDAEYSSC